MHPWLWWHCCSRWIQRYHIAFANSSTVYTGGVAEAATISHPSIIATHWNCWNWRLTHSLNQRRSEFGCSGILLSSTYLKSPKLSARKSEFKDFLFFVLICSVAFFWLQLVDGALRLLWIEDAYEGDGTHHAGYGVILSSVPAPFGLLRYAPNTVCLASHLLCRGVNPRTTMSYKNMWKYLQGQYIGSHIVLPPSVKAFSSFLYLQ